MNFYMITRPKRSIRYEVTGIKERERKRERERERQGANQIY
mgnify:CR=1 FL=1